MTENEAIKELRFLKPEDQDYAFGGVSNASGLAIEVAIKALEEVQQYRVIGTVEECKASADKMKTKKLSKMFNEYVGVCECGATAFDCIKYCSNCGQAIDWS